MCSSKTLEQFEHLPSNVPSHIFGEEIVRIAEEIRNLYKTVDYDHRAFLPEKAKTHEWVWTEEFRRGQACFKYAVAAILQPKSIIEIGVGAGITALAFHASCNPQLYIGVDMDTQESFYDLQTTINTLASRGVRFSIVKQDSRKLDKLGRAELFHIDGGHDFETAKSDMFLAWRSETPWILVDDSNDAAVVAGVFSAIHELPHGKTDYAYFEDTWSGNLLFRRNG